MIKLGIVTDNQDPENLRRVRVMSPDRGNSVSDWLSRISLYSGQDIPVPNVGDTVILGSIDNDSHTDCVIGVLTCENSNQPLEKDNLQNYFSYTQNHHRVRAEHILLETVAGQVEIHSTGLVEIKNELGSLKLLPSGYIVISNPSGTITFGSGGINITSPGTVEITSPNLTHNGTKVALIGGTDSRGDTTLS